MTPIPQDELKWRERIEDKIDKLFSIVNGVQIECAKKSGCYPNLKELLESINPDPEDRPKESVAPSGREKFLMGLLTLAVAVIAILADRALRGG